MNNIQFITLELLLCVHLSSYLILDLDKESNRMMLSIEMLGEITGAYLINWSFSVRVFPASKKMSSKFQKYIHVHNHLKLSQSLCEFVVVKIIKYR